VQPPQRGAQTALRVFFGDLGPQLTGDGDPGSAATEPEVGDQPLYPLGSSPTVAVRPPTSTSTAKPWSSATRPIGRRSTSFPPSAYAVRSDDRRCLRRRIFRFSLHAVNHVYRVIRPPAERQTCRQPSVTGGCCESALRRLDGLPQIPFPAVTEAVTVAMAVVVDFLYGQLAEDADPW
jgi:hypothetical protein